MQPSPNTAPSARTPWMGLRVLRGFRAWDFRCFGLPVTRAAMAVLNLLLVLAELLFHFLNDVIDRCHQFHGSALGHKIVLVFGRYTKIYVGRIAVLEIDRHVDSR